MSGSQSPTSLDLDVVSRSGQVEDFVLSKKIDADKLSEDADEVRRQIEVLDVGDELGDISGMHVPVIHNALLLH